MLSQTRVVLSTVGPYNLYGTPLVDCCVKMGVDYCDVTGEAAWVKTLIDKYHQTAVEKKVIICPMCGYDSIPSDLGCFFVVDHIKKKYNTTVDSVKCYQYLKGSISGGTVMTMLDIIKPSILVRGFDKKVRNPYLLNTTQPQRSSIYEKDFFGLKYDKEEKLWAYPFLMGSVNTRVVRRSNSLLAEDGKAYGPNFIYNEFGSSKSFSYCIIFLIVIVLLFLSAVIPCTRFILRKFVPQPGEGPSEKERAKKRFQNNSYCANNPITFCKTNQSGWDCKRRRPRVHRNCQDVMRIGIDTRPATSIVA